MTRLEHLRREALKSTTFRGHRMRRFQYHRHAGRTVGRSDCMLCGAGVVVNTKPLPNEIDIGGEAVALHCTPAVRYIVGDACLIEIFDA